jgi:hypothetical protein
MGLQNMTTKPVWKKKRPKSLGKSKKLTPTQQSAAKAVPLKQTDPTQTL